MTKAELIEAMKEFPDDLPIYIRWSETYNGGDPILSVERTKLTDYEKYNVEKDDYLEIDCICLDKDG